MDNTVFVKAVFDLDCEWEGLVPSYRIYVGGEIFAERSYIWTNQYLTEILQIQAPPGQYEIRLENLGPGNPRFITSNHRIADGHARWIDDHTLEI